MRKQGFTLIELLVVIAIVVILMAMIMPVMLEAKNAAHMKRCVSNLKQLGQAITMYMDDNNGFGLPADLDYNSPHYYENSWVLYVKPLQHYLGQQVLLGNANGPTGADTFVPPNVTWVCQGDICRSRSANDTPIWYHYGSSYMYPGCSAYIRSADPSRRDYFYKDARCTPYKPMSWLCHRRDLLLCDYWFDFHNGYKVPRRYEQPEIFWGTRTGDRDARSINALFLDQHVAVVTPSQRDELVNFVCSPPPLGDNPYATTSP